MTDQAYFRCPHCGGDVPYRRTACPHCGSSESDGWKDHDGEEGFLNEEEFDYEDFVAREFEEESIVSPGLKTWQVYILLMVLISFGLLALIPLL